MKNQGYKKKMIAPVVITVIFLAYLIAYGIAKPLTLRLLAEAGEKLQTNAAMVVGMGLYTVLNYLGQRFFAFKSSKSEDTDDHVAD